MLRKMLTLRKTFVAYLANEGFADGAGHRLDGGGHLVLDDGGRLAQSVALALRLDGRGGGGRGGHAGDLHGDAVPLGVPLPHGVRVVEDEVAVGQLGRHPHQLQRVRVDLDAAHAALRDGRHRDDGLGAGHHRAAAALLGDGDGGPLAGCVVLNLRYGNRHRVDIVSYLS